MRRPSGCGPPAPASTCTRNSLKVFEAVGAYEAATRGAFPGRAREMRDDTNTTIARIEWPAAARCACSASVRQNCIDALAAAATEAGAEIVTGSEVAGASPEGDLVLKDGRRLKADLIIGADGVGSPTRDSLGLIKSHHTLPDGAIRLLIPRTEHERTSEECQTYVAILVRRPAHPLHARAPGTGSTSRCSCCTHSHGGPAHPHRPGAGGAGRFPIWNPCSSASGSRTGGIRSW